MMPKAGRRPNPGDEPLPPSVLAMLRPDLRDNPKAAWTALLDAFRAVRLAYDVAGFAAVTGVAASTLYSHWSRGEGPKVVRLSGRGAHKGSRLLIPVEEALAWRERHLTTWEPRFAAYVVAEDAQPWSPKGHPNRRSKQAA